MEKKSIIYILDATGSMPTNGRYYALLDAMSRLCEEVFSYIKPLDNIELNARILFFGGFGIK